MIKFTNFYNDIEFMAALFINKMLTMHDIKFIADKLVNCDDNSNLINILVSTNEDYYPIYFQRYLDNKNIKIKDVKRTIIKKLFYYILQKVIDFDEGINFAHYKISDYENTTEYIGDDVGIEKIIGNYSVIDDGDTIDPVLIEQTKQIIEDEMRTYINNN